MAVDYELFIGKTKQGRDKKYIVAKTYFDSIKAAKKVLKVAEDHILCQVAYTVGDDLFFIEPHKRGQKKVYASFFIA